MDKKIFYCFEDKINMTIALQLFKKRIQDDPRFSDEIFDEYLTVEEKYFNYYSFDALIYNQSFLYKNKITNKTIDSKIDIQYRKMDKDYILNELSGIEPIECSEIEDNLLYPKKYNSMYQELIEEIKDKALCTIMNHYNITPSKNVHIDVAPLEGFEKLTVTSYYEKIYFFRYRDPQQKKDFQSILSSVKQDFYELDYVKSEEYMQYLTQYKKPMVYLPKEYYNYYYIDSYRVYRDVMKKLEFENPRLLLKKIKDNIKYEDYSQYKNYLISGIYYFKIKRFLKKIEVAEHPLKRKIYLSYLTFRYQKRSGMFLYDCARLGILPRNSIHDQIKFLEMSYSLGDLEAKKKLYEHYSSAQYYNEILLKKYS